jgi:hypothetical protein
MKGYTTARHRSTLERLQEWRTKTGDLLRESIAKGIDHKLSRTGADTGYLSIDESTWHDDRSEPEYEIR